MINGDLHLDFGTGAGAKLTVLFPPEVGFEQVSCFYHKMERLLGTVGDEKQTDAAVAKKAAVSAMEPAPFPTEGAVTSKEIAAAFRMSESTWRLRVRTVPGYPAPLPRSSEGSPNYWRAEDVLETMRNANVPRRQVARVLESV